MRGYVSQPGGGEHAPAVIVIHHGWGVDEVIMDRVDDLAQHGFVAVAPDLYHRQAPEDDMMTRVRRLRDREVTADVDATTQYLEAMPATAAGFVGILGFCMGGRVAYLIAGANPRLKAAAVFYGGDIMVPWGEGPSPLDLTPHIRCPIIGFFGADDTNPSAADVKRISAELERFGKAHEFHSYPDTGHAFLNFRLAERYREAPARDAWARLLAFLDTHLKKGARQP
jgi:carboxymethylenebutenolidase